MAAPVQRRSRLLTPEDLVEMNDRMNDPDLMMRAHAPHDPPVDREAPDNDTLLQKAAGGEAADDVRRRRFR